MQAVSVVEVAGVVRRQVCEMVKVDIQVVGHLLASSCLSISVIVGFKVSSCSKRKEWEKTGHDKCRGPFS